MLGGQPHGEEGIDLYDAACSALAIMAELHTQTDLVHSNKALDTLLEAMGVSPQSRGIGGDRRMTSNDTLDDVLAMREMMAERAKAAAEVQAADE